MKIMITGARSEITIACKQHLQKSGHTVVTTSHSASEESLAFDLAAPQANEKELDQLLAQGLDVLILNAASPTYKLATFEQISFAELDSFLRENIQGNIWLLQKVLPVFKKQNFGRIVFISSGATQVIVPGYSVYAAAKSAIEVVVKYISSEIGDHNITANTLRLGIFETERNRKFIRRDTIKEKMLSRISLKRLGTPKDLFLILEALLEKDSYIQGTVIDVNGGISKPT